MMPGTRLLAFARRWFPPTTVSSVLEPLVADWQREWQDSSASRRTVVTTRGLTAFVCAAIVSLPRVLRTPAPSTITNRMVTRIAGVTFIGSVIFTIPFALQAVTLGPSSWVLALLILPSSMAVVFPFAMIAATDAIRRHEPLAAHVQRATVLKLGIVAVLLMALLNGWVVPASNQVWRVMVAKTTRQSIPSPGVRELSTVALIADPSRATVPARFTRAGEIRRELNNRILLAVLPVLLLWVRWPGAQQPRRRWYAPIATSVATAIVFVGFFTLYYLGLSVEPVFNWQPGTGLWLPVVIFGLVGLLQQSRARRSELAESLRPT